MAQVIPPAVLDNASYRASATLTPADLFDRISSYGREAAYVAAHVVRIGDNCYERFKVLYHYLARGTEFAVGADSTKVLIDGRPRSWSALDGIDTVHGTGDSE